MATHNCSPARAGSIPELPSGKSTNAAPAINVLSKGHSIINAAQIEVSTTH